MSELIHHTKHLKRLSSVKSNAGVRFLTPAASLGSHCPMHIALSFSSKVKGLSTLIIGTPECTTYGRLVIPKASGKNGEMHWLYVLDSHEVVFGCRNGLIDAIRTMSEAGAKAILLIVTCVPELIGEDIEGMIHEIQPEIQSQLTFVMLGHFKCNSYPSGSWKTFLALGNLMRQKKQSCHTVNVLGRSPSEEHIPMPHILTLLEQQGCLLRCLAYDSSLDEFLAAPDAILNIVLSPFAQPLANLMSQMFQIPSVELHNSYEVSEIEASYDKIFAYLGIQNEAVDVDGKALALCLQKKAQRQLIDLSFVVGSIGPTMVVPLVSYLAGFEMTPLLLHIEEVYPDDKRYIASMSQMDCNPPVCHMVNHQADIKVIASLAPDLYIGNDGAMDFTKTVDVYELYGQIGYQRTIYLLSRILQNIENIPNRKGIINGITSV